MWLLFFPRMKSEIFSSLAGSAADSLDWVALLLQELVLDEVDAFGAVSLCCR